MNMENDKEKYDESNWGHRVNCRDGNCVGTVSSNGRCKTCDLKYDGELPFATDSKRMHKTDRDSARESGISLGDDLIGKPDGTYQYYDNQGKMQEGWMPPEKIENILKAPGAKKLSKVLIKGPWEGAREELWKINNETIEKFADNDGTIYVMCVFEKGEPTYLYMSKGVWVNAEKIVEISRNPYLLEEEKKDQIDKFM